MNPIPFRDSGSSEEHVKQDLQALAMHDALLGGSDGTRAKVLAGFRTHQRKRVRVKTLWTLAAAACITVIAFVARTEWREKDLTSEGPAVVSDVHREQPPLATPPPVTAQAKPAPSLRFEHQNPHSAASDRRPVLARRDLPLHSQRASERNDPVAEVDEVTDFFPLTTPAMPFERGQLLRVTMPSSAMQMIGLPVREDRMARPVQADILVGEEGIPRAIRFVNTDFRYKR